MIKTITKHAQGSKRIPILGMIHVVDGVMTTTDMDSWISGPCSLPDGMYHGHGFDKGVQIVTKLPVTDFPLAKPFDKKSEVVKTVIDKDAAALMAWALKAASTESARYYLNGVFFDWMEKDGVIVATDGHRLHTFQHDISGKRPQKKRKKQADGKFRMVAPITGAIMPTKAVKAILNLMKEQPGSKAEIKFQGLFFKAKVGKATITGKLIDGTYPHWRSVVPTCPAENVTPFNPAEIKALAEQLGILTKISNGSSHKPCIRIYKGTASPAMLLEKMNYSWPVSCNMPFEVGFNLKYLMDLCDGTMHYKDPAAPFKVVSKNRKPTRMAVIMPMRV